MPKPTVAILCPREFRFTDSDATVESPFLADVADVRTVRLDYSAPFPAEVFEADAHILWHGPRIDAPVIAQLKRCRAIIRNGVGFDTVDLAAAAAAGIPVCNVPDYGTEEVADSALGLALTLARGSHFLNSRLRRGVGAWNVDQARPVQRLRSRVFGIVGCGRIGSARSEEHTSELQSH